MAWLSFWARLSNMGLREWTEPSVYRPQQVFFLAEWDLEA